MRRQIVTSHSLQQLRGKRWFGRQGALVQELVGDGDASDTRVLVCGGDVVGAVRRRAPAGWRADSPAAQVTPVEPTPQERRIAEHAASVFDADLVTVELLSTELGPVVLELDAAAEFDERCAFSGQSVFDEVARRLVESPPVSYAAAADAASA